MLNKLNMVIGIFFSTCEAGFAEGPLGTSRLSSENPYESIGPIMVNL